MLDGNLQFLGIQSGCPGQPLDCLKRFVGQFQNGCSLLLAQLMPKPHHFGIFEQGCTAIRAAPGMADHQGNILPTYRHQYVSTVSGAASTSPCTASASNSCIIWTPLLAPIRFAPAATRARKSAPVRIPPAALTPNDGPTTRRIRAISATVAPPPLNPVEVLTKSALAAWASAQAAAFSSSVSSPVSMITLTSAPSR